MVNGAQFSSSVHAKSDAIQVNEMLYKPLAHSLCVLTRPMLQLGIEVPAA
ncbi:MAG: hypothetical protein O2888_00430 [Chloroflexi bacterium]|nr:hypothetical protein [Chloroflexota bacterium]